MGYNAKAWERRRHENCTFVFVHGSSVNPKVFKKADKVNNSQGKELKKSTNIDFEQDLHSEIRDVVTTIVRSAATPMDVDTQIMSIKMEKSHGEREGYEEDHDSEQHGYQDEEGGPMCHVGKSSGGGWKVKGKDEQKGKGGYTKSEHGYNGGNNNYNISYNHYNGSDKGGGKFVNVCDPQSFAPQPQATYQNPGQGNRLMTTRWNGHV